MAFTLALALVFVLVFAFAFVCAFAVGGRIPDPVSAQPLQPVRRRQEG
ncbi:hypothetical protein ACH4ZU_23900 [Streptomyces sp. NPDC020472]